MKLSCPQDQPASQPTNPIQSESGTKNVLPTSVSLGAGRTGYPAYSRAS